MASMDESLCGFPMDELVPLTGKLLEVPQQLIRTALQLELQGTVIADNHIGEQPRAILTGLDQAEPLDAGL